MPKDLHLPIVSSTSGFGVTPLSRSYSFVLFSLSYLLPKPTRGSPSLPCAFTQAVECGWKQGKQHSHAVRSQFKSMGATDVGSLVLSSIWHRSVHRGNFFYWGLPLCEQTETSYSCCRAQSLSAWGSCLDRLRFLWNHESNKPFLLDVFWVFCRNKKKSR